MDCLEKINFTIRGPLGKMGPKIKESLKKARFDMIKKLTGKEPEIIEENKSNINPYYSSTKPPGA